MGSTVTLKAAGLNTSPNQLELPEGSLIEAKNVLIRRDGIIEPMRGYKVFGTEMAISTDRAKTLFSYRERILRHYGSTLEFQNGQTNDGEDLFTAFLQALDEAEANLRIKKVESNGNLYLTSSTGIKKISALNGDSLASAQITDAGGIKAVDLRADLQVTDGDQSSFLPQDSAVAYRVVWASKDNNTNLVRGSPSQREEVYNPMGSLLIRDFHRLLRGLDGVSLDAANPSLITDGDYVDTLKLPMTATAIELQTNLVSLASKIDQDIVIAEKTVTTAPLAIDYAAATAQVETVTTVADVAGSLNNKYFYITSTSGSEYYVWMNVNNAGTDPAIPGKTGIEVALATGAANTTVATTISSRINSEAGAHFSCSAVSNVVTITQQTAGVATAIVNINTTFTFGVTTTGNNGKSHLISSGIYTITFSSGDPTLYWGVGSKIYLDGFNLSSGNMDGVHSVSAITSTTISINTAVTGPVTVAASAKIECGVFRGLPEPAVPNVPTSNNELQDLQDYLNEIISALQLAPTTGTPPIMNATSRAEWIDGLDLTTTASVRLTITIPDGITTDSFYQIYRSSISQATDASSLDDLIPSDELQQVYEGYPTSAEITAGSIVIQDVTPDDFRGADLYTNPATGEGILQANDLPPYAKDINRFKNVVFYANTRTRHRLELNLLGVQQMLNDFDNAITPKLSILSPDSANTYTFVKGEYEQTEVTCLTGGDLPNSGTGAHFLLNSANDETEYYIWYSVGTATDPAISGKTGIKVQVLVGDTAAQVAAKTAAAIASHPWDFAAEADVADVIISTTEFGTTTAASDVDTGFTVTVTQTGVGEDAAAKQVLLSSVASVALAVDETARSLVRVINKNADEEVYAYYLSGNNDVPGKILLESKNVENDIFYVLGNNAATGASFNPDVSGDYTITSVTTGMTPVITTSTPHGMVNGSVVAIAQTDSTPALEGAFQIYEATSTSFKIDVSTPITVAGTSGVAIAGVNAAYSDNEVKPNRLYYSKLSQPEAVPLLNYVDVGDSDKAIVRIFPLRDSLFIFKEEGLYRLSGDSAPFSVSLFDSSCQITGPDTVDVNNNLIYLLTTQGVMTVSEGGVNIISRAIDNIILRLPIFPRYKELSFGVGYESDNCYTLWTVQKAADENATIGYRYSNLTNTWTTVHRNVTCGFVNPADDKSYYGPADLPYIEQERKDFDRTDYAGREYDIDLILNNYEGNTLRLTNASSMLVVGDVITQTQQLTCYEFNMALKKLDSDPQVGDSDYFASLEATGGVSLRASVIALAQKLDADSGVVGTDYFSSVQSKTLSISSISTDTQAVVTTTTPHGLLTGRQVTLASTDTSPSVNGDWIITVTGANTFTIDTQVLSAGTTGTLTTDNTSFNDIKACFNIIMNKLNTDDGVSFANYRGVDTETVYEAIVTNVNRSTNRVTLDQTLDFVVGPLKIYKAIDTAFTYGPNTFGNPVSFKHFSDATMMFESKAFTIAKMQFATDLLPEYVSQTFNGDGNGIFGNSVFGEGFFGGASNSAPFRTYVPRQCQRGRFLVVRFNHMVARESYKVFGTTLTGNDTTSTRAYRG